MQSSKGKMRRKLRPGLPHITEYLLSFLVHRSSASVLCTLLSLNRSVVKTRLLLLKAGPLVSYLLPLKFWAVCKSFAKSTSASLVESQSLSITWHSSKCLMISKPFYIYTGYIYFLLSFLIRHEMKPINYHRSHWEEIGQVKSLRSCCVIN